MNFGLPFGGINPLQCIRIQHGESETPVFGLFRHSICSLSGRYYLPKGGRKGNSGGLLQRVPRPRLTNECNRDFGVAVRHVVQESPQCYAGFPFYFPLAPVGESAFFPIMVMKELENCGVW
jgi:hypothetical protein